MAAGLSPDFWVKTLHHCDYWSARKDVQNDNIWCVNPEETVAYMSALPQPWIAYKVLAAGAIHPSEGFKYAFRNGADFICVGMYDFQIVEDVNIALTALGERAGAGPALDRVAVALPRTRSARRGLGPEPARDVVLQPPVLRLHDDEALDTLGGARAARVPASAPMTITAVARPSARVQSGARTETLTTPFATGRPVRGSSTCE